VPVIYSSPKSEDRSPKTEVRSRSVAEIPPQREPKPEVKSTESRAQGSVENLF